jgi:hypothetical protein
MYTHDGKMVCDVTGTTIDPECYEGFYSYKIYHICALAYTLFDSVLQDGFNFENLPKEAQESFVWEFQGDPDNCLFGGSIRDKSKRNRDRIKLHKKEVADMNNKWDEAKKMLQNNL